MYGFIHEEAPLNANNLFSRAFLGPLDYYKHLMDGKNCLFKILESKQALSVWA